LNKGARGQAVVITALALLVLVGMAGMATDIGYALTQRNRQQHAAQGAALAAAVCLAPGAVCTYQTEASTYAAKFGYTSGVTSNSPPASGARVNDPEKQYFVEVIIQASAPTFFMGALGFAQVPLKTRAVARWAHRPNTNALIALRQPPTPVAASDSTMLVQGVNTLTGNIYSNGNINSTGDSGASVQVQGQARAVGSVAATISGTVPNAISLNAISDPYLNYPPEPAVSPGSYGTLSLSGSANPLTGDNTLQPGTYSSVTITGGTYRLRSGVYRFTGSGLAVQNGATICNANGNACGGVTNDGPVLLEFGPGAVPVFNGAPPVNGGRDVVLSSGPAYRNFLVWVERSGSPCSTPTAYFNDLGTSQLTGILYAPCSTVHFEVEGTGAATVTITGQVIGNVIEFYDQNAADQDQVKGVSVKYDFHLLPALYGARLVDD
jgi:hypothetical protein